MSKLHDLMAKEMTRKQFLIALGTGILGLLGLSTLMGILSPNDPNPDNGLIDYGMRNYGP